MKEKRVDYRLMNIETVSQMLQEADVVFDRIVIQDSFAINLELKASKANSMLFDNIRNPYLVKDYRIMRFLNGYGKLELNFKEYRMKGGDVLFISENTYFEMLEASPDAEGEVVVFYPDSPKMEFAMANDKVIKVTPDPEDWKVLGEMFRVIHSAASLKPFRKGVVLGLVEALAGNIIHIWQSRRPDATLSRSDTIYRKFIEELTLSGKVKRRVSYYSDRLCVTPQYLSKVVSQASGKSVSEWINKALLLQARILLADRSHTVSEISDALGFPSDSHFCRFFKRETTLTPTEYRGRV